MKHTPRLLVAVILILAGLVQLPARAQDYQTLYGGGVAARNAGDFPAAEALFEKALAISPGNTDVLLLLGLVRAYQKKYAEALSTLERGQRLAPERPDLGVARARVLSWWGRDREALSVAAGLHDRFPQNLEAMSLLGLLSFRDGQLKRAETIYRQVLEAAPESLAALVGLGDVLKARGDGAGARQVYQTALRHHPEADLPRTRLAAPQPAQARWRLDLAQWNSWFERRPQRKWTEGMFQLGHEISPGTWINGGLQYSRRFGLEDVVIGAGFSSRINPGLTLYGRAQGTPDADFLSQWGLDAGGSARLGGNADNPLGETWLTLDLRQRRYALGDIQNVNPGLRQVLFSGRVMVAARWVNTFDNADNKHLQGWNVRLDVLPVEALRLYAGLATSPESDRGVVADTDAVFGGVSYQFTQRFALRLDFARERRENSYIRNNFSAGLSFRF